MQNKVLSNQKIKGILCIIMAAFCFALMNIFVRLSGDLPSVQKSFFRNAVALIFAMAMIIKKRVPIKVEKGSMKFLFGRALFGTIGVLCNFYAVDHLMVADASMLNKLSPFFAIVFSYFLLKEKVKPVQIVCVVTAFVGMLFIIKPGVTGLSVGPAIIGACGGMTAGLAYTFVRILGQRGVKGPLIVCFFSGFSCLVTLIPIIFNYAPMTGYQWAMLFLAGLAASGGQFAITAAYTYAPAREISIYDYSQIIFSTILGFFVLNQIPDAWSFVGYAIIIGASLWMFLYNNRKAVDKG